MHWVRMPFWCARAWHGLKMEDVTSALASLNKAWPSSHPVDVPWQGWVRYLSYCPHLLTLTILSVSVSLDVFLRSGWWDLGPNFPVKSDGGIFSEKVFLHSCAILVPCADFWMTLLLPFAFSCVSPSNNSLIQSSHFSTAAISVGRERRKEREGEGKGWGEGGEGEGEREVHWPMIG